MKSHSPLREAFPVVSKLTDDNNTRRPHIVADCRSCDAIEAIPLSKQTNNVPAEYGKRLFRNRGWKMGATRAKDCCPKCSGMSRIMAVPREERVDAALYVLDDLDWLKHTVPEVAETPEPIHPSKEEVRKMRAHNTKIAPAPTAMRDAMTKAAIKHSGLQKPAGDAVKPATETAIKTAEKKTGKHSFWDSKSPEERSEIMRERYRQRNAKSAEEASMEVEDAPAASAGERQLALVGELDFPSMPVPEALKADTPRTPTREDNRRIRDALDEHYDERAGAYHGSMRDKTLAGKLIVPVAWVAAVREQFFGPDKCEVDDVAVQMLKAQAATVAELETEYLRTMEDFDARITQARKGLMELASKLGVTLSI